MREVDGGDGGGQFLRSALALSALSGDPVRVESVRGDRSDPGLKAQHLAAVEALARVTDADVEGDELGSETVTFDPGRPRPGEYAVDVGTAGSVTLVFDAVLPLAVGLDGRLSLTVAGGTDVKWSPPMAYYRRVKLPLLRRAGVLAAVDVDRRGFYPAGSGRATLHLGPSDPTLALTDRGALRGSRVYSTAAAALSDSAVARRQAEAATRHLREAGVEVTDRVVERVETACPGSAVAIAVDYEGGTACFSALGEEGKPAEAVAGDATAAAVDHLSGTAPIDEHMADQVVTLLALGGGRVRAPRMTDHLSSSLDLLASFGYRVDHRTVDDDVLLSG